VIDVAHDRRLPGTAGPIRDRGGEALVQVTAPRLLVLARAEVFCHR